MDLVTGINVGNTLDSPKEGDWGWVLEESHFDVIRDAGFDHVRVPIRWSTHADAQAPYTIDPHFFDRIDWVVGNIISRGMIAVINMHHYQELFETPLEHFERFTGLWRQISEHYSGYGDNVYFEILNEPNNALTPELWNDLLKQTFPVIRASNPNRWIAIDTALWGSYKGLQSLALPDDSRIIVSFHFYLPPQFCFQGAPWTEHPFPAGMKWRGRFLEKRRITRALDLIAAWAGENGNVPLWNGEYCVHKWADMDSRVRWTRFVTREARKRGIANTIWNFHVADSAGLYDPQKGEWIRELLEAVVS